MPPDERHDLYVKYYDAIVRYLMRKFRFTVEEARDLAQETFLRVFRRMEKGGPITAQWLFVKVTAHNLAVNEIRQRTTHRKTESGSTDDLTGLDERGLRDFWSNEAPASPESITSQKEQSELLRKAIEELPVTLRTSLLLRLRGLSYEEIAIALGTTADAIRTRLRDAKRSLLDRMRPGGGR